MTITNRHSRFLTILLLLVQLCLPLSGSLYISSIDSASEAGQSGKICAHTDADTEHESRDGHEQIAHCHELDPPGVTASGPALDYSPVISTLASSNKGALLDGYGVPFDIPPEHRV